MAKPKFLDNFDPLTKTQSSYHWGNRNLGIPAKPTQIRLYDVMQLVLKHFGACFLHSGQMFPELAKCPQNRLTKPTQNRPNAGE